MLRFSANLSTLFQELPLAERFEAAARAGFDAVELWFPYEIPAAQMRERLAAHGLRCVGINSAAGDVSRGDWGLAADPARRAEFDASVEQAFDYAQAIGCPSVHVMAGQIDAGAPRQSAWEHYVECMGAAADRAAARGLTVMVEPLNAIDRPRYLLNTQAQALELLGALNRPNLKIMLDLYHVQRGEGNLIERMRASLPHAAHVQIADNPGRHEPGTGEIRFESVFAELARSGYSGLIGCEYLPSGASVESFGWLEPFRAAQPA
ncbi:hydroxypyruvate isomerase family protein [Paraburkholderia unamae]|uniref:Hydroxypyruvate isomerase n=1 Tax=Paraburkholderia unamae TaxID=219649 RepID=A0ABX5KJB7_9BURK|nr:TIM barrel protein [Paraburkholderia unamae]PVX77128.1 hydroxypyruvate isomerase [Paraburkholderia unamae]RAR56625.1 hydroxypyruvate isomerase [Paraburkholderia unamae]